MYVGWKCLRIGAEYGSNRQQWKAYFSQHTSNRLSRKEFHGVPLVYCFPVQAGYGKLSHSKQFHRTLNKNLKHQARELDKNMLKGCIIFQFCLGWILFSVLC
jgi:hypothetical protein